MHILFFSPYFNQPRGNSTTVKRVIHFLQLQNINASVIPYLENDNWHYPKADIFHILHATRFLKWAKDHDFILNKPYLVTMGGTDINVDLQKEMDQDMFAFLNEAKYITVFNQDAREKVEKLNPNWADKTKVIQQGIWLPWGITELTGEMQPNILLPAGLRSVKDVLHVLPALDILVKEYPNLRFTILGANLDNSIYKLVEKEMLKREWMDYAGVVPYEVMKVWYEQAEIVINTSIAEGQSLAVMEAMAMGRPVIARNNEANKDLIHHRKTGWLYETMTEFIEAVKFVLNDKSERIKVMDEAKNWITENHSPYKETDAYINLYDSLMH